MHVVRIDAPHTLINEGAIVMPVVGGLCSIRLEHKYGGGKLYRLGMAHVRQSHAGFYFVTVL